MDSDALSELDRNVSSLKDLPSYLTTLTHNVRTCSDVTELLSQLEQDSLFQMLHSQVHSLDILEAYLEYLKSIRSIDSSLSAMSKTLDTDFKQAYDTYRQIENSIEANDSLYLKYHSTLESLQPVLKSKFTHSVLELLSRISWPFNNRGRIIGIPEEVNEEFLELIQALLDLSSPEEIGQLLSSSFEERFRFHFMSDRDTSKVDKPEWYLEYSTNVMKYCNEYLYEVLATITIHQFKSIQSAFIQQIFSAINIRLEQDVQYIMNFEPSQARVLLFYHADQILMFMHGVYYDLDIKNMYGKYMEIGNVTNNWIEKDKTKIEKKYFKAFNEKFGKKRDLFEVFLEVAEEVMNNE